MRILVTGSTGLLGSALVEKLVKLGREVCALIRETSDISHIENKGKIRFVKGDVLNRDTLEGKLEGIDIVIHCAARTLLSSRAERKKYKKCEDNVIGTKNMADFALQQGVKQFIYLSSCAAIGECYDGERDETFPCQPDSEYGKSKLESEKILMEYEIRYNFPMTILRPGPIYGAYDRTRMKKMIELIDRKQFIIFGNGRNKKSLVSVHNVVEAIVCALGNPKALGEVFIVTDGKNYSLNDICKKIAKLLPRKQSFLHIPNIITLMMGIVADFLNVIPGIEIPLSTKYIKALRANNTYKTDKIVKMLNYHPRVSLQQGLAEEVEWYRSLKSNSNFKRIINI